MIMSVSLIDGHIDGDMATITDKELMKTLQCCAVNDCKHCPLDHIETYSECSIIIAKSCLNLINRKNEEIEKCENIIRLADNTIEKQSAEIERLYNEQTNN